MSGPRAPIDPLEIGLDGRCLVEASAGTGKTFTIAILYVRLVMERRYTADRILVVTYTNAAAAELRERIRARLQETVVALSHRLETGETPAREKDSKVVAMVEASVARGEPARELEALRLALRAFDEAAISTIHGFCQRMLDENAFESGVSFGTELVPDQRALVDDVVADFWTRSLYDADPTFVTWLREQSRGGQRIGPRGLSRLADTVASHPRIAVVPERPEVVPVDLDAWHGALAAVRAAWAEGGREALAALATAARDKALHKGSYPPDKIEGRWYEEIEAALADARVGMGEARSGVAPIARLDRARIAERANKGRTPPEHPLFDAVEAFLAVDAPCAEAFATRRLALELDLIAFVREALARRRRLSRTRSFDDLLTGLADALEGEGGAALAARIRERFPAALIDEFQDTDPIQYAIFERVWRDPAGAFFQIGDPKQAIYGFRGADVFAYMQAKRDAADRTVSLDRNWRSDPSVVAAVNALFEGVDTPFLFDEIPFHAATAAHEVDRLDAGPRAGGLRLLHLPVADGEKPPSKGRLGPAVCSVVADDVAGLLGSGATRAGRPLTASDVAVLCRTNRQARAIQERLRRRGVPSVMQTQESVFETDEAEDLERILAAAAEPGHLGALRAAITTPWVGVDAAGLLALDAAPDGLDPWLEEADAWARRLRESGPLALVEHLLASHRTRERLIGAVDGERRLTNGLHLAELMQANARGGAGSARAHLRWLARMRRDAAARAEQAGPDAIIRLESDARAVQLVTIHRSKGLQYGVVYCPFLWEGGQLSPSDRDWVRFHDPDEDDRLTLDLGSPDHDRAVALGGYETFAESLRLLYVALTRARHQVVVPYGRVRLEGASALGFLLHPPEGAAAAIAERDPALVDRCRKHLHDLSDEAVARDLEALAARSGGAIRVETVEAGDERPVAAPGASGRVGAARRLPRRVRATRRVSSYSRLVTSPGEAAGLEAAHDHPAAAGRDYDARPAPETGAEADPATDAEPVRLHAFPAGAGPGTLIHRVLERHDFTAADPSALEALCAEELARAGWPGTHAPPLAAGLAAALATPLGGALGDFALRDLDRADRLDELEFALPVALDGTAAVTPERLGEAFARHGESAVIRAYGARVAALPFPALAGHLRGFVDLVFRHAGRYYVVDYKSNRLGPAANDYAPARLELEMVHHDYWLQSHLYTLALDRLLAARLAGYAPDTHLGGVYYLFVRGMAPDHPIGTGVHHHRPPPALVAALSAALGGGTGPQARRDAS